MTRLVSMRRDYHRMVGSQILRFSVRNNRRFPNFADGSSQSSIRIGNGLVEELGLRQQRGAQQISGQTAGSRFEGLTCEFIRTAFDSLAHLRPGQWTYKVGQTKISNFVQYAHLEAIESLVNENHALASALGHGYVVTPDIVVARQPVAKGEVDSGGDFLSQDEVATLTPFIQGNMSPETPLLHASISCKWTIRSDRSQNTRTEALNLIRNRKGNLPHIVAVTAEPLPMRIASLALGTGDLDCVYHFALGELRKVCASEPSLADQSEMLEAMVAGNRLRDISDLPFDLAV
ncbi:MAG: restriction endonuclease [Dehalococcoidia bacterium]|nr:restriction endonuclease [Dehalococcoidia bacterium]